MTMKKNRTFGFYLGLAASVLAIGAAIAIWGYGSSVGDLNMTAVTMLLLGGVTGLLRFWVDFPFYSLVSPICCIVGWGSYLKAEAMTIGNHFNKIEMGSSGSAFEMIMFFVIFTLVIGLLGGISAFLHREK